MQGNMRQTMKENISKSDFFIVIGTPRFKQRVDEGLPKKLKKCIQNGEKEKLVDYLETLETGSGNTNYHEFNPTNNVAFEMAHIWTKVLVKPESLLPLLFYGDSDSSFPSFFQPFYRHDARARDRKNYHNIMASLANPIGLISRVFQLNSAQKPLFYKDYVSLYEKFKSKCDEIELELDAARKKSKNQQVCT